MAERYFSAATFKFQRDLAKNNNRTWFAANKQRYEDVLRDPFLRLIADMEAPLAKISKHYRADPRPTGGSLFRIYRDTRFSKDRTPYKTHFSAAIRDRSKRGLEPGYYFHIDHAGMLLIGGGIYRPEPGILKRVRAYIAARPEALTRMLRHPRFRRTYSGFIDEDALVRPPKGYSADTPHIEAIKLRHFFAMNEINVKRRPPKDLAADLADGFRDLLPMMEWLRIAAAEARQ